MDNISDTYLSISSNSEGLYKESGSRFISFAYPVESEGQVRDILDSLRKEYHDARHCCYAYRLGKDGEKYRANDDGEPSSSAGKPILGQIDSRSLSDVLVVVVRYFGGIKLGIPGLINAYRTAASDALSKNPVVTKTASRVVNVRFDYSLMPFVMNIVKDMDLEITGRDFGENCSMGIRIRLSKLNDFFDRTKNLNNFILD